LLRGAGERQRRQNGAVLHADVGLHAEGRGLGGRGDYVVLGLMAAHTRCNPPAALPAATGGRRRRAPSAPAPPGTMWGALLHYLGPTAAPGSAPARSQEQRTSPTPSSIAVGRELSAEGPTTVERNSERRSKGPGSEISRVASSFCIIGLCPVSSYARWVSVGSRQPLANALKLVIVPWSGPARHYRGPTRLRALEPFAPR
jgi:hypothetical protein